VQEGRRKERKCRTKQVPDTSRNLSRFGDRVRWVNLVFAHNVNKLAVLPIETLICSVLTNYVMSWLVCRAEMKHKLNPVLDAQLNRNRKVRGHRRNFSDGRITSSLTDNMVNDVSSLYPPP
jgi:hypothetical protein